MKIPVKPYWWLGHRDKFSSHYYIHIPKCGGTYVERIFTPYIQSCPTRVLDGAQGHLTLTEYESVFRGNGLTFDRTKIFSVVRNPWSWHVSWFNYIRQDVDGKSGHKLEHQLFKKMDFADYIHWLDDPNAKRGPQGYLQKQISDWLTDEHGNIKVESILKQETLEQDLKQLVKRFRLNLPVHSMRLNASQSEHYTSYYNSECREIIRRRHSRDIALFGYQF